MMVKAGKKMDAYGVAINLFKALLFFASDKGEEELPSPLIGEHMLFDVSAAVCEYSLGKEFFTEGSADDSDFFRRQLNIGDKTKEILGKDRKLNRRLKEAFSLLLGVRIEHDCIGDKGLHCWLLEFYRYIDHPSHSSVFKLMGGFAKEVEEKVLPVFDENEIECIKEIAELMKPHIKKDIEYIKKCYHW